MAVKCVIHYKNQSKYSKSKGLSEINKKQILEAKDLRCILGGDNFHEEQCDAIPEKFDESLDGIHLECYKKYVHFFIRREGQKSLVLVIFASKNWVGRSVGRFLFPGNFSVKRVLLISCCLWRLRRWCCMECRQGLYYFLFI